MWLAMNSMQSACARVLGCSMLDLQPDLNTWASTCEQFSTLNGKHTQQASWARAWKKEAYIQRLYGSAISPSSQQQSFEDWWIASLRDSPAKTSASPAAGPGLTANALACSSTSSTLPTLAVRGSSFWRTSQASLLPPPPLWTKPKGLLKSERLPESWENWPTAGGMRNGSLFQRPTWAPAMGGRGGFALPGDKNWTTPQAHDVTERGSGQFCRNMDLILTENWPTPRSTDGTKGGPNQAGSKGDLMLPSAAAQWPTPNAHVIEAKSKPPIVGNRKPSDPQIGLADIAVRWPTPAARDAKGANSEEHCTVTGGGRKHMDQLSNFVAHSSHPALQTQPGQESSSGGHGLPPQCPVHLLEIDSIHASANS